MSEEVWCSKCYGDHYTNDCGARQPMTNQSDVKLRAEGDMKALDIAGVRIHELEAKVARAEAERDAAKGSLAMAEGALAIQPLVIKQLKDENTQLRQQIETLRADAHNLKSPVHAICNENLAEALAAVLEQKLKVDALSRPVSEGVSLIAAERKRQVEAEGWTPEHDAEHIMGEMIAAAICYAELEIDDEIREIDSHAFREEWWPWEKKWWKPSPDPIRNLVRSGALIAAEIDRIAARAGGKDNGK